MAMKTCPNCNAALVGDDPKRAGWWCPQSVAPDWRCQANTWVREVIPDYPKCATFALRDAKAPLDQIRIELHSMSCRKSTNSPPGWRFRWPEMQIFKALEATTEAGAQAEATAFLREYFNNILRSIG